jgi:hypothetical protein
MLKPKGRKVSVQPDPKGKGKTQFFDEQGMPVPAPRSFGTINYKSGNVHITSPIRVKKLEEESLIEALQLIYRDQQGKLCQPATYDKESGKLLEQGYGRAYVNEDGELILNKDVDIFQMVSGKEERVEPFQKTSELETVTMIDEEDISGFLPHAVYEVIFDKPEDAYKVAQDLDAKDKAMVTRVVFRKGFSQHYGIIHPYIDKDGSFTLLMTLTQKRIEPQFLMSPAEIKRQVKVPAKTPKVPKSRELF